MSTTQLSLNEYLTAVQEVIRIAFDEPVWVKAGDSELKHQRWTLLS